MPINTLCVLGTRPEAIKMAPIIQQLNHHPHFKNQVCMTGQHQHMVTPLLDLFDLSVDFNLEVMTENQSLTGLTTKILTGLADVFKRFRPDVILVHGDTTTTLAASLSAYYHRIPIAHVEAGLRTWDLQSPWPEEANRKLTGALASWHFAPTAYSRDNLLREAIPAERIFVTGNTVIDALFSIVEKFNHNPCLLSELSKQFSFLTDERPLILVTGHRRENFGQGFEHICRALRSIAESFPYVDIVYPVHLNPNVLNPVTELLGETSNIHLIPPVDYLPFVYLMKRSYLILTDSGGIQEEAPSLGKPVLVLRDKTERPEALESGTVLLVGSNQEKIVKTVHELLTNNRLYQAMSRAQNPYGDGQSAQRIITILSQELNKNVYPEATLESTGAIC